MTQEIRNIRYTKVGGAIYFCAEDVVNYIRTIAATEETDVRWRLYQAATNLAMAARDPSSHPAK